MTTGGVDYAEIARQAGVSVEQVIEIAALDQDLRDLADGTMATRIIFSAVDLERSRAERARPDTDAESAADEWYFEHWSA